MANRITIARFPLLILTILLLYAPSPWLRMLSVIAIIVLIIMDSLDGMVARARHEESLLGSVLDIMTDRSVELVLWICYGHLGLISVVVPIIFVLRGTVVDSLRSVWVGQGQAPFKAMRSKLGKWLVSSPWMRSTYAVCKVVAFAALAVAHMLAAFAVQGSVSAETVAAVGTFGVIMSWLSVFFCLARGIPVVVELLPRLAAQSKELINDDQSSGPV